MACDDDTRQEAKDDLEESPFRPYQDPTSWARSASGDSHEREFCAKPHHVGDGQWDTWSSL